MTLEWLVVAGLLALSAGYLFRRMLRRGGHGTGTDAGCAQCGPEKVRGKNSG